MITTLLALGTLASGTARIFPLDATIREVVVHPGTAVVTRGANASSGDGRYVVEGLPAGIDADDVRVRAEGASVVGVELRARHVPAASNARVEELRALLAALGRERQGLEDEALVAAQVEAHLKRLFEVQGARQQSEIDRGVSSPETWGANLRFLRDELAQARGVLRDVRWRTEALDTRIGDVQRELGQCSAGAGVDRTDLVLDLAGVDGPTPVHIEYRVGNAGWTPLYDLSAARDARSVDLTFRAQVWQASGEDWSGVVMALSTAQPLRGAQGPDPDPIWLSLFDPRVPAAGRSGDNKDEASFARESMVKLGESADYPRSNALRLAAIDARGLSVRYALPGEQTVESRPQPTHVLVGQATLACSPEYFATPSLDLSVWLRGRTKNTSPLTLLPGVASVFLGGEFLGRCQLDAVQPGQEFTLHLGSDPALELERVQKDLSNEQGGVFSNDQERSETWLVRLKNHGALAGGPDGKVKVFVREALPRSSDERLEIELASSSPKPLGDARWKQDRDEQGIATWLLEVPRGGEAQLQYRLDYEYPEGARIAL